MKFAIHTRNDIFVTDADSISEACDQFDWKYPGTVIAVMQLPDDCENACPNCGAEMGG